MNRPLRRFNPMISAFRRAPLSFELTTTYTGKQKMVLIARTADGDDVARAHPFAQDLQAMGRVIVVSVEFDVSSLAVLASDDAAFEWNDPMSPYPLIDFWNTQLSK
ncbi:unnamed protein product, partial [Mesorhabditis belari]|uniref:Uncharacterized protein n=1 Tax=Mesorhabditis belari TaxID=2138241 RepID=A0AAF3FBK6_9BILA